MLLESLRSFAEHEERLPRFYARQRVGYRIDLDSKGRLISLIEVDQNAPECVIPYVTRTSQASPLPIDRGDYVLGIATSHPTRIPAGERHAFWIALLDRMASATEVREVKAVHRFASSVNPTKLKLPKGFDASRFVAIYVNGVFFPDDKRVRTWWREIQLAQTNVGSDAITECSVCGKRGPVVENVTTQVRGLVKIGGKSTMALVSGNLEVFERHGLPRASGAAICRSCGESTHQALNQLIRDPVRSKQLGNTEFLWWATEPVADFIGALLAGDSEEAVAEVFQGILTGRMLPSVSTARFHAVSLGANVNRVMVRSWVDITLREALANARSWLDRVAVIDHGGNALRRPGLWSLVASLAPAGTGSVFGRVRPGLIDDLLRSALTGAPLPYGVFVQCLERLRAEQGRVTTPRASLLKVFLTQFNKEGSLTQLDSADSDPAYLCGRLLALLDRASRLATTANNSLVDRSYAAASTMPALTFPRLIKLHRAHIDKLRRDKPGAAYRIQESVEAVVSGLHEFPKTFGPTEQGRFALGLYHQMAADHAAATAARAARDSKGDGEREEIDEEEE
jgi:CRISPR-associated protein Csd1